MTLIQRSSPRAFWQVAIAFAIVMAGTTIPSPLTAAYRTQLGLSVTDVTVVYATYAVGVIVALVTLSSRSDALGRRAILLTGVVAATAGDIAFLLADSLVPLLIGRILSGLSAGAFTATATAALIDLMSDRPRRAGTVSTAANMAGLGVGALMSGGLATLLPWPVRTTYAVHLLLLVGAATLLVAAPGRPKPRPAGGDPSPGRLAWPPLPATTAGFAGFTMLGLLVGVTPLLLPSVAPNSGAASIGATIFLVLLTSSAGQLLLVPRLGNRAFPGGCILLVMSSSLLVLSLVTISLPIFLLAAAIGGLGQGTVLNVSLSYIAAHTPHQRRGSVVSAFFLFMYIAISLPVIGVGLAAPHLGLAAAGSGLCATVAATAVIAVALWSRPARTTS